MMFIIGAVTPVPKKKDIRIKLDHRRLKSVKSKKIQRFILMQLYLLHSVMMKERAILYSIWNRTKGLAARRTLVFLETNNEGFASNVTSMLNGLNGITLQKDEEDEDVEFMWNAN